MPSLHRFVPTLRRLLPAVLGLAVLTTSGLAPVDVPLLTSEAEAAANPFRAEVLGTRVETGGTGTAEVRIIVPSGHHVYRDMMWVKVVDPGGLTLGDADFPTGLMRPDPANPGSDRELFDMDVIIHVPIQADSAQGTFTAKLKVGYQGCKGGLCFMPATEDHDLTVDIVAAGALPKTAPTPPPVPEAVPAPAPKDDQAKAAGWREGGLVSAEGGAVGHTAASGLPTADFSGLPASASVQKKDAEGKDHPVHARLILDHDKVRPGQTVRLGLHLTQKPGWHTYWHSPGDIGLPTDITWSVPPGSETTPYAYPVPHRYDVSGIISYGYDDQVLLFTDLTLPSDLPAGTVTLGATAKWLVCEVMCIPGEAELSLPVEVVTDATPDANQYTDLFDHFAAQHAVDPKATDQLTVETALSASAVQADGTFKAAFFVRGAEGAAIDFKQEAGTWPAFTPIYKGEWMVSDVAVKKVEGGLLAMIEGTAFAPEELPTADRIGGLVQVEVDGKTIRSEVVLPLPWAATGAAVTPNPSPLFALFDGAPAAAVTAAAPADGTADDGLPKAPVGEEQSLAYMLVLAFLGGAILNIMPCVLPVLTLKLYSVVDQQDQSSSERQAAGLSYTAGVVASFWALALAVVLLRSVFELPVGWGFQFQYPEYVAALATIVFVFGLSLFGVFEVPAFGANSAAEASDKEGLAGHFLTGTFTTLLATPCSAPLLGTGMGFAFGLPSWGVFLFFTVAALGLASPFLLIAFVPALMRFLPRPGAWMETFKQLMGFTLIATTVWLVDVMGGLVGQDGLVGFLGFLVAVGAGCWVFGRWGGPTETSQRQLGAFSAGVVLSGLVGWQMLQFEIPEAEACDSGPLVAASDLDWTGDDVPWQPFSEERVSDLAGQPVFIDFTADWCLTCKVNEKTVLNTDTVRDAMRDRGVVPLKADWTRKDEVITAWLQRYGRAGVPFYLVVPKDRSADPIPLPEVITPDLVADALAKAAG